MLRRLSTALALLVATAPASARDDPAETFASLRAVDGQLAAIGYRLVTANRALCDDEAPAPGWALHALDQYDPALRSAAVAIAGFEAPVAVEAVVPGSPAALAGVAPGDSLVAVNGHDLPREPATPAADTRTRDAALDLISAQPDNAPMRVTLLRGGRTRTVVIASSPACRARFEVQLGSGMDASSDGTTVQIAVGYLARYTDAEVAAVTAHELAHIVLHHRARLTAAGVATGITAEFGRNGRLHRRAEDEADRLSVALLRNAGYDPQVAVRFWRQHGGDIDGGLFRSRTHPSSTARAKAIAAEAAAIPADAPRPWIPPVLATRARPFE